MSCLLHHENIAICVAATGVALFNHYLKDTIFMNICVNELQQNDDKVLPREGKGSVCHSGTFLFPAQSCTVHISSRMQSSS